MRETTLALILRTLSRHEKLDRLAQLSPMDAAAIDLLIDDCLTHRWPTTNAEWFAMADKLSPAKH